MSNKQRRKEDAAELSVLYLSLILAELREIKEMLRSQHRRAEPIRVGGECERKLFGGGDGDWRKVLDEIEGL